MPYVQCFAACFCCKQLFGFNPMLVPSITIAGVREPICADCVAWVNPIRVQNGLDPIHVLPGAYEPAEDTKIYWEFD